MNRLNRIALCAILLLATKVIGGESPGEAGISARRFTLEQAILTALQQNPDILRARQEIERTKGLFIQLRAAAMPQIVADARFQDLDPHQCSIHPRWGRNCWPGRQLDRGGTELLFGDLRSAGHLFRRACAGTN